MGAGGFSVQDISAHPMGTSLPSPWGFAFVQSWRRAVPSLPVGSIPVVTMQSTPWLCSSNEGMEYF